MKTMILMMALSISSASFASSELVTIEGVIRSTLAGEIDPVHVGDACLIEVETENKAVIGLLTDYESCIDGTEDLTKGRGVTVVVEKKDRIKNRKVLNVLKNLGDATVFYKTEFGAIENGLAD